MKKTLLVMTLAVGILLAPVMQAGAINKEWSAVLGFLGGYMVANGGLCPRTVYQEPVYIEQPVYRETVIVEQPVVTGHYELREQRIWVPGSWEYIETLCGRVERVWREGFYRTEMIRVWVNDYPRYGRHHRR